MGLKRCTQRASTVSVMIDFFKNNFKNLKQIWYLGSWYIHGVCYGPSVFLCLKYFIVKEKKLYYNVESCFFSLTIITVENITNPIFTF